MSFSMRCNAARPATVCSSKGARPRVLLARAAVQTTAPETKAPAASDPVGDVQFINPLWSQPSTEKEFLGLIAKLVEAGKCPPQLQAGWIDFYQLYRKTVESSGVAEAEKVATKVQATIADTVFNQVRGWRLQGASRGLRAWLQPCRPCMPAAGQQTCPHQQEQRRRNHQQSGSSPALCQQPEGPFQSLVWQTSSVTGSRHSHISASARGRGCHRAACAEQGAGATIDSSLLSVRRAKLAHGGGGRTGGLLQVQAGLCRTHGVLRSWHPPYTPQLHPPPSSAGRAAVAVAGLRQSRRCKPVPIHSPPSQLLVHPLPSRPPPLAALPACCRTVP